MWFRDQEVIPKYTLIESSKSSLGEEIVFLPDKINLNNEISESIKSTKNDAHITNITKFKKKDSDTNILSDEKVNNFKNQLVLNSEDSAEPEKKENVEIIEKDKSTVQESTVQSKKSILAEEEYATQKFEEPKAGKVSEIKTLNLAVAEIESNLSKLNMHQTEQSVDMKNISHNFTSDNKSVKSSTTLNLSKSKKCKSEDIKNNCGTEFLDSVTKVEKSLFEWFSLDTLFFLFSERQLKEIFREKTTQLRESLNSRLSIATYDEKIEKMIQLYGLLESGSFRNESPRTNLQPLPDYSALQKESKFLEIKVKAFYGGQLEAKNLTAVEKEKEKESGEDNEVSLPLIDSQAQNALRRKIVLDKLNKM